MICEGGILQQLMCNYMYYDIRRPAPRDKNVFIPFFPALGRVIKHRVSDHLQTTLFIRLLVFISEAVFFLLVLKSYNPVCGLSHRRSSYVSNAVTAQYPEEQARRASSFFCLVEQLELYVLCFASCKSGKKRPARPTRDQPRATPWEAVMCDSRPERAKALP